MYSLHDLLKLARSGTLKDIDLLMDQLTKTDNICTCKMTDYALGTVDNPKGIDRIEYYLFHGTVIQRNYAAVFFKRSGRINILKRAVKMGSINAELAFSK